MLIMSFITISYRSSILLLLITSLATLILLFTIFEVKPASVIDFIC